MSKRIPVSVPQPPLQSPFLALSSEGLPETASSRPIPTATKKPRIVLRREKSQRGGKTVIVISQLPTHLSGSEIEKLARDARRALATGGSVQDREIEVQGDQAARVRRHFEDLGYDVAGP